MFDGDISAGGSDNAANNDASAKNAESGAQDGKGTGDDSAAKIEFSKEQQDHIGKLLSKERKAAADKARVDAKAEADASSETARKAKEAEDAKQAGDFEKVETALKSDLDTAKTESAALKAENDQLRAAMAAGLEDAWKAFPEAVRKLWKGEDADVLGKWTYLHDADVKALVKDLTDKAPAARGNGRDPKSSGDGKTQPSEAARTRFAQRY